MMKKLLACLLAALTLTAALPVSADVTADAAADFIIEGTKLVKYVGEGGDVVIPDGITVIGETAFMEADLIEEKVVITSVQIPDSVTVIERGAFVNCSGLKEVYLPDSVQEVGDYAFYGAACASIRIPETLQDFGHYSFFAFPFYDGLMNQDGMIVINDVLVEIDATRYKYPENHTFAVPDGIQKLRLGNFGDLSALVIPDSVVDIGDLYNDEGNLCITKVYARPGAVWEDSLPNGTEYIPLRTYQQQLTLTPGRTAKLLMGYDFGGKPTYRSDNSKVASVDKNGKITAKSGGTATITVNYLGVTSQVKVIVPGKSYIVKRGDTLWSIAARELGSGYRWKEILTINRLGSKIIHAGKKLYLPE